jgi:glutathione peroxidase
MRSIEGKEISFDRFKGKKVLLINTASECGYTPQYTELQSLHEKHGDKLVLLGFPANNFGGQEPGENAEIGAFCQKNFGVTFQLMEKSDVIGENTNPVYRWLTDKNLNGWNEEKPSWNFCKYLVDEKGELVKFFSAAVSPLSDEIVKQL